MKFLSATWTDLLFANYVVDADLLEPFVPKGTRLDPFDGKAFVSLVAFLFDKTRVLGIPIPGYRRFEEVNLRFYVTPEKDTSIRAVTFIKEIVPKRIIPLVANNLFDENYVTLPMDHGGDERARWYSWRTSSNNRIEAKIGSDLAYPEQGSVGEFITEHYWGYTEGSKRTLEYEVKHPQWKCCVIEDYEIDVDFGATYGQRFAFLSNEAPFNFMYAKGSEVSVSFPGRLV